MIPAALAAAVAAPLFVLTSVHPWKYNDGRQEYIPALSAMLDNRSGQNWHEARFRVEVARVDGDARVEFIGGKTHPPAERPSYVVLGFSYQDGDGPPATELEGILDHRRKSDSDIETHRVWWREQGERLAGVGGSTTGYYCFRVEPGVLGLSGFLLSKDPQGTGPLASFLRFYEVPAGSAAFLGVFRVVKGPGEWVSVVVESGEEDFRSMRDVKGRPVIRAVPRGR